MFLFFDHRDGLLLGLQPVFLDPGRSRDCLFHFPCTFLVVVLFFFDFFTVAPGVVFPRPLRSTSRRDAPLPFILGVFSAFFLFFPKVGTFLSSFSRLRPSFDLASAHQLLDLLIPSLGAFRFNKPASFFFSQSQ